MPSLRQISTSRSAQDTKAPIAQTVMSMPTVLDNLIAAGRIPPMTALFVHAREEMGIDPAELVMKLGREPDFLASDTEAVWELAEHRHYTTSKLGAWVALTRAVELADAGQVPGDDARWRSEADRIRRWVESARPGAL